MSLPEIVSVVSLCVAVFAFLSNRQFQTHSASREETKQLKQECADLRKRVDELESQVRQAKSTEVELLTENHSLRLRTDQQQAELAHLRALLSRGGGLPPAAATG